MTLKTGYTWGTREISDIWVLLWSECDPLQNSGGKLNGHRDIYYLVDPLRDQSAKAPPS